MFKLNDLETLFIGLVLEGFFHGLYSGVFGMYLVQHQSSKEDTNKKQTIVFDSICVLYVLSVAVFVADITQPIYIDSARPIYFIQMISFGCCDFIAQFILIYRCWIVWGCNIRVVIIPSILAFSFLVIWIVGGSILYIPTVPDWADESMALSSLALSLAVNALVTGLIVFRIFKVFREVKTMDDQILGATGGSKLWRVMFILIESGIALFSIQLARVVASITVPTGTEANSTIAFNIIVSIHEMLNGITPTIILVRTSMNLSFHDEKSMEEVIGSLCYVSNHSNIVQETGVINIVGQDNGDGDIGVERSSNDIELVAR